MEEVHRIDTLKFSFDRKFARPKSFEVEDWLETIVKIRSEDIIGYHLSIVDSVMYLKLSTADLCEKVVAATGGSLKFNHRDGNVGDVSIDHAGIRTLRIFELPFEVSEAQINSVMSSYGTVVSNIAEKWSNAHRFQVLNGVRQLKMVLRQHVPSYIDVCGYRGIVIYDGQPRTCAGCNKPGHIRSECMQRRVAQLPAGETVKPPEMTTLRPTFTAVARGEVIAPSTSDTSAAHSPRETNSSLPETPMETSVGSGNSPSEPQETGIPQSSTTQQPCFIKGNNDINLEVSESADVPNIESNDPKDCEKSLNQQLWSDDDVMDTTLSDTHQQSPSQKETTDSDGSQKSSSSRRGHKKRRLARKGAEKTAKALREKAKQVSEELNASLSGTLGQQKKLSAKTQAVEIAAKETEGRQESTGKTPTHHNDVRDQTPHDQDRRHETPKELTTTDWTLTPEDGNEDAEMRDISKTDSSTGHHSEVTDPAKDDPRLPPPGEDAEEDSDFY